MFYTLNKIKKEAKGNFLAGLIGVFIVVCIFAYVGDEDMIDYVLGFIFGAVFGFKSCYSEVRKSLKEQEEEYKKDFMKSNGL